MKQHLIICSKYPRAGYSKTRLIVDIGAEKAALLQKEMTEKLITEADLLFQETAISLSLSYSGASEPIMYKWLGDRSFLAQKGDCLGSRMEHAFASIYAKGYEDVIVVGSDVPALDSNLLQKAFNELEKYDTVIGPTEDGGYYLIGMKKDVFCNLAKNLFHNIPWSTEMVYPISAKRIFDSGYTLFTLPLLRDIDHYADLLYAQEKGYI